MPTDKGNFSPEYPWLPAFSATNCFKVLETIVETLLSINLDSSARIIIYYGNHFVCGSYNPGLRHARVESIYKIFPLRSLRR